MDISLLIRQRLNELRLEQRDLAVAIQVTDSYVSQLLTGKKSPPAPGRTDIYDKMGEFLRLPAGELSRLAEVQRQQDLRKRAAEPTDPLFKDCRDLVLRKTKPAIRLEVRRIFEKEPFGVLERLVTQTLLGVAQGVAKEELQSEEWLRLMAQLSHRSYKEMRVATLELLDADVFNISLENCLSFLDPIIDSWDIDLKTFSLEVLLNRRLTPASRRRFEFVEQQPQKPLPVEPGLKQFLLDKALSGDVSEEEIEFLMNLPVKGKHPVALYYYRELQSILRDPLHFGPASFLTRRSHEALLTCLSKLSIIIRLSETSDSATPPLFGSDASVSSRPAPSPPPPSNILAIVSNFSVHTSSNLRSTFSGQGPTRLAQSHVSQRNLEQEKSSQLWLPSPYIRSQLQRRRAVLIEFEQHCIRTRAHVQKALINNVAVPSHSL